MTLANNPIFLTQKRLVHRGGILAAILIAALVGLSLLSGLIAYLADPLNFSGMTSPQDAGKVFYAWTIAVEILILIVGGFNRISNVLGNERKAGLWDSNRLTPLKPQQLIIGYWFGSPLREFYMSVVLAVIGFLIVLLAKLPVTLWLGTQIVIFSTAFFFGLLAVLLGLILQRPQAGLIFLVLLFFSQAFSFMMPRYYLTDFLLPIYGIVYLFMTGQINSDLRDEWGQLPEVFGFPVYPVFLTLALQLLIGVFLWKIVIRKTANPFHPALFRWEAVALFAIFMIVQHGLIWAVWKGNFPIFANSIPRYEDDQPFLAIVQGGTLFLALIVLAFASPQPESIRVSAARAGIKTPGDVFFRSSAFLAFALAGVVAICLFTHFIFSISNSWKPYLISVLNLLAFSLTFSLLLEFCRLRYKRRALGFLVLWLFILWILPFILAGVFGISGIARFSILAPGCAVLGDPTGENMNCLLGILAGHFGIAVLLFIGWQREWKKLLSRAA